MIKRIITKKFIATSAALFALLMIYAIPKNSKVGFFDNIPQKLKYVDSSALTSPIYLLDSYNYLARTSVVVNSKDTIKRARELMEVLIKGGSGEGRVPNGFRSLLPSDTKILSINFQDNLLKINFSKELFDVKEEYEEKIVEAIVFTLTSIEEIKNVIIYVEGDVLTKLPKTGINLPPLLNRNFGINKEYKLDNFKQINQVTVYYINKHNESVYYIPVTKYVNDNREKVEIIIDELSSNHVYNTNLKSYLSNNAKLLSVEQSDNTLDLKFNNYIFSDDISKTILEEVIYTICLSVKDNYNVEKVVFSAEDQKIYENVLKTLD